VTTTRSISSPHQLAPLLEAGLVKAHPELLPEDSEEFRLVESWVADGCPDEGV
jgi:hypothetical protein